MRETSMKLCSKRILSSTTYHMFLVECCCESKSKQETIEKILQECVLQAHVKIYLLLCLLNDNSTCSVLQCKLQNYYNYCISITSIRPSVATCTSALHDITCPIVCKADRSLSLEEPLGKNDVKVVNLREPQLSRRNPLINDNSLPLETLKGFLHAVSVPLFSGKLGRFEATPCLDPLEDIAKKSAATLGSHKTLQTGNQKI